MENNVLSFITSLRFQILYTLNSSILRLVTVHRLLSMRVRLRCSWMFRSLIFSLNKQNKVSRVLSLETFCHPIFSYIDLLLNWKNTQRVDIRYIVKIFCCEESFCVSVFFTLLTAYFFSSSWLIIFFICLSRGNND